VDVDVSQGRNGAVAGGPESFQSTGNRPQDKMIVSLIDNERFLSEKLTAKAF
jgi:hypothetical protein